MIPRLMIFICFIFLNFCLSAPRPTLGHYQGDSLTHPVLTTAFQQFQPEGYREPLIEVGSLAERLARLELRTFRF